MTNEELERAIDFLLKSQANLEARIEQGNINLRANIVEVNKNLGERIEEVDRMLGERIEQTNKQLAQTDKQLAQTDKQLAQTDKQLAQTNRVLGEHADTLTDFIRVMTTTWEAQGLFNNSMRTAYRKLAEKVDKLKNATGGSGGE